MEESPVPLLSEEAWALLALLNRTPGGLIEMVPFEQAFTELKRSGFAQRNAHIWSITELGKTALTQRIPSYKSRLDNALRYVAEAELRIAEQAALVERLRNRGGDVAAAEARLNIFRKNLAVMREHVTRRTGGPGAGEVI